MGGSKLAALAAATTTTTATATGNHSPLPLKALRSGQKSLTARLYSSFSGGAVGSGSGSGKSPGSAGGSAHRLGAGLLAAISPRSKGIVEPPKEDCSTTPNKSPSAGSFFARLQQEHSQQQRLAPAAESSSVRSRPPTTEKRRAHRRKPVPTSSSVQQQQLTIPSTTPTSTPSHFQQPRSQQQAFAPPTHTLTIPASSPHTPLESPNSAAKRHFNHIVRAPIAIAKAPVNAAYTGGKGGYKGIGMARNKLAALRVSVLLFSCSV